MIDCILLNAEAKTATIYYKDGRVPFTVTVDQEILLDVVRNLVYNNA